MKKKSNPAGWIYVISHPQWAALARDGYVVKIGMTKRDPRRRGLQICSASGLLGQPRVEFKLWVSDARMVERMVHAQLAAARLRRNRELFCVSVIYAQTVIETVAMNYHPRTSFAKVCFSWLAKAALVASALIVIIVGMTR
jgi:hypothetical protein